MTHERIYLNSEDERVYIDAYIASEDKRPALLVIPGGAYARVCADREGDPIAERFLDLGYNAFVLNYRCGSSFDRYPKQLFDAAGAMIYIRENAERLSVDKNRVFAAGFSAGGHLAGSLATMLDYPEVKAAFGDKTRLARPTGVALAYPVIRAYVRTNRDPFRNLLGKNPEELSEDEKAKFSIESALSENSSPFFVWHTREDTAVPLCGTFALAEAAYEKGVNFKLAIYPYGPHGVALANKVTECGRAAWVQPLAEGWVEEARDFFASLPSDKFD